jgi:hypothetical protein
VKIESPDREMSTEIFRLICRQRQIEFHQPSVELMFRKYYDQGRTPRSSDPRDVLTIADSICRFHERPLVLSEDLIDEAARRFFGQL